MMVRFPCWARNHKTGDLYLVLGLAEDKTTDDNSKTTVVYTNRFWHLYWRTVEDFREKFEFVALADEFPFPAPPNVTPPQEGLAPSFSHE